MIGSLVTSAVLYVVPKGLDYLCTRIPDSVTRVDRLRDRIGEIGEMISRTVSARTRFIAKDLLADNAWIAFLILSHATKWNPYRFILANPMGALFAMIAFSSGAVVVRHAIGRMCPALRQYVIP